MPNTLAEKILQAHTDDDASEAGRIVRCRVSLVLANDITAPLAIKSFRAMGAKQVFDRDRVALVCDHFTPFTRPWSSAVRLPPRSRWRAA
jgi:3-isopropylmalate/(R)-2-methylmalate dehydratase large subunit